MQRILQRCPWLILLAGALIQIFTGIPSAWGAFQKPVIAEYALNEASAGYVFSVLIAGYGVGCAVGGFLQDRWGPRKAALLGTILLCGGIGLAGVLPAEKPWLFYLAFSIPAGVGSAFLNPAVLSCAQKWYQGRKGLATGVVGCAMGLSGLFLTQFVKLFTKGPWQGWGVRGAFFGLALLTLPVCLAAGILLENPQQESAQTAQDGQTPGQMLRSRNYWLLIASVALSTPAVQLFSPRLVEIGGQRGLAEEQALWAVMLGSLGNAAGRLAMPVLSDKIGRKQTELLLFGALAGASVWFWLAPGFWMLAAYTALCVCYSGLAAVLPAFATDLFGLAHAGVNYGLLALGQTVGSLAFPLLADGLGLTTGRHLLAVAAAVGGIAVLWGVQMPKSGVGAEKL